VQGFSPDRKREKMGSRGRETSASRERVSEKGKERKGVRFLAVKEGKI